MGFAPVIVLGVAGLDHPAQLAAAVDPQRDDLLIKRRYVRMSGDFGIGAAVGYEDPAGTIDVSGRRVLGRCRKA